MKRIYTSQKGASAVEFAIVLPLLVLLLFGIIEFSLLLYNKAILTNASREGARQGIVFFADPVTGAYSPKTEEEIRNVVNTYANNYLITFSASLPVTPTTTASWDPSQTSGALLAVNVQYTYTFLVLPSFMSGMLGDTLDLGAETVMRME